MATVGGPSGGGPVNSPREAPEDATRAGLEDWGARREKQFYEEDAVDPVFDGMVKDFERFDEAFQEISETLEAFVGGVGNLTEAVQELADSAMSGARRCRHRGALSAGCALREAANRICHADAEHSASAKLLRNLEFNVTEPIQEHLTNNKKLREKLERRGRRLVELREAKQQVEECHRLDLDPHDRRFTMAMAEFDASRRSFKQADRHCFEWLYALEEHRGDIFDSYTQTLKHMQYEFFSASAHALHGDVPTKGGFRPLPELDPERLWACARQRTAAAASGEPDEAAEGARAAPPVVEAALREAPAVGAPSAAWRLAQRAAACGEGAADAAPVDFLSLSALVFQGFEEGPARRALRSHGNDTQAAAEWLLRGGGA